MVAATAKHPSPPAVSGAMPLIGHLLEFKRDPLALIRRGAREHGKIFSVLLGPKRVYFMIGPEMNTEFFAESDKKLSVRAAYKFLGAMFSERTIMAADEVDYKHQRALLAPMLGNKRIGSHFKAMLIETQQWLDRRGGAGRFDAITEFEHLTMHIIAHALLGDDFRRHMGEDFYATMRDLELGIDPVLPPRLPIPRFIRRDRAKRKLQRLVGGLVEERRAAAPGTYDDSFQMMVKLPDVDGQPMSVELITNIILWLIHAGHETTSSHLSWVLIQLLQHPDYLARIKAALPAEITLDSIRGSGLLHQAIQETERKSSPSIALPRITTQPYEVGGYVIPAGKLVFISPTASHMLPEIFTSPDSYDPDRFSAGRAEDRKAKNALVGFGGGRHKCWGVDFAYVEMAVVITMLLQHYDVQLLTPDPKMVYVQIPRPERPTWIGYRRREHQ
jgi:sterol 14alpha-demethylase